MITGDHIPSRQRTEVGEIDPSSMF
jgi:hypothetical protein